MSKNNNSSSGGISLWFVLGIVFLVLKLTGVISWSWWLVTLPFYFPFVLMFATGGFFVVVALVVGLMAAIVAGIAAIFSKR